jgi:hypothetical protein
MQHGQVACAFLWVQQPAPLDARLASITSLATEGQHDDVGWLIALHLYVTYAVHGWCLHE